MDSPMYLNCLYPPGVNRPVSDHPEFRDPLCQCLIGIPAGKIIALTGRNIIGKADRLTVGSPNCTYAAATVRMEVQRIAGGIAAASGTAAVFFGVVGAVGTVGVVGIVGVVGTVGVVGIVGVVGVVGSSGRRGRRILRNSPSCRNSDTAALTIGVPV